MQLRAYGCNFYWLSELHHNLFLHLPKNKFLKIKRKQNYENNSFIFNQLGFGRVWQRCYITKVREKPKMPNRFLFCWWRCNAGMKFLHIHELIDQCDLRREISSSYSFSWLIAGDGKTWTLNPSQQKATIQFARWKQTQRFKIKIKRKGLPFFCATIWPGD